MLNCLLNNRKQSPPTHTRTHVHTQGRGQAAHGQACTRVCAQRRVRPWTQTCSDTAMQVRGHMDTDTRAHTGTCTQRLHTGAHRGLYARHVPTPDQTQGTSTPSSSSPLTFHL